MSTLRDEIIKTLEIADRCPDGKHYLTADEICRSVIERGDLPADEVTGDAVAAEIEALLEVHLAFQWYRLRDDAMIYCGDPGRNA